MSDGGYFVSDIRRNKPHGRVGPAFTCTRLPVRFLYADADLESFIWFVLV